MMFSCTEADDWMRSPGTVNAGQSWSYNKPARPGDTITLQARALDKFIKHRLKAKYYLRYADDFSILSSNPHELLGYLVEISSFLEVRLKLHVHPNKVILRKLSQGVDFVGYVALPHYNLPRLKTVKRIFRKVSLGFLRLKPQETFFNLMGH